MSTSSSAKGSVPFARGFRRPTAQQIRKALGLTTGKSGNEIDRLFSNGKDFFRPVSSPSSEDDWLAQYKEEGQTFDQFVNECPWLSSRRWKMMRQRFVSSGKTIREKYPDGVIYLLPLGSFHDGFNCSFEQLADYTRLFYGNIPVRTLAPIQLVIRNGRVFWEEETGQGSGHDACAPPPSKRRKTVPKTFELSARFEPSSGGGGAEEDAGHFQLSVDSVLARLRRCIPDDAICLVALTMADLYETKPDLFVAGMAAGAHRVAVFSFFRYNPMISFSAEYWYDIWEGEKMAKREQRRLMLQRSCRLLVHEIAHLLGIGHCIWYACCMNGSGHLDEDFSQPMQLCPVDLRKLHHLCGFDVVKRYEELLEFFDLHDIPEESRWLRRRLAFLDSSK